MGWTGLDLIWAGLPQVLKWLAGGAEKLAVERFERTKLQTFPLAVLAITHSHYEVSSSGCSMVLLRAILIELINVCSFWITGCLFDEKDHDGR